MIVLKCDQCEVEENCWNLCSLCLTEKEHRLTDLNDQLQKSKQREAVLLERLQFYLSDGFECNECGSPDFRDEQDELCEMCNRTKQALEKYKELKRATASDEAGVRNE